MFKCEMTVEGNGEGRYGRFKQSKTGPVSRFMVDNTFLYAQVKKHILSCSLCDPTEALRHYLNRRLTLEKFKPKPGKKWPILGHLTISLADLALRYERQCSKTRPVPAELVNEFIWRTANAGFIVEHEHRLSVKELVFGAQLMLPISSRWGALLAESIFRRVCVAVSNYAPPETEQELEDLIVVMETMVT